MGGDGEVATPWLSQGLQKGELGSWLTVQTVIITMLVCPSIRDRIRIRKCGSVDSKGGCTNEGDTLGGTGRLNVPHRSSGGSNKGGWSAYFRRFAHRM